MNAHDRKVTIRIAYEAAGICAQAVLQDVDRPQLVGTGRVVHHREDPFPAREELAVIQALQDLTNRLVARERTAHLYSKDLAENSRSGYATGAAFERTPHRQKHPRALLSAPISYRSGVRWPES